MKMLISCVVLLCVAGAINGLALGAVCNANTTCADDKLVCQDDKCKLKIGQVCTANAKDCVTSAECTGNTTQKCTCPEGKTPNDDKTKCGAINGLPPGADCNAKTHCADDKLVCQGDKCKLKIGQDCTNNKNDCVTSATCSGNTKNKCTCPEGKTPNDDKTKCAAASASAVASVLLMVAAFLSSRWM